MSSGRDAALKGCPTSYAASKGCPTYDRHLLRLWGRASALLFVPPTFLLCAASAAAISLISVNDEIAIGREAQSQISGQTPEVRDGHVVAYIERIGRQLASRAEGPRYPYTFDVANYREVNAFALPGGPVWVHRGAIEIAETEAQLAGVLAHEVAHIAQRHAADQLTKSVAANFGLGLLSALLGNSGGANAAQIAARFATGGVFLKFSRDHEREADRVGAGMMHRAGWDARGMLEFMQLLNRQAGRRAGSVETFFSTHPSPANRVALLRQHAGTLRGGRRDSAAFRDIRTRLRRMPPAPSMRRSLP
jgi:beta-barrel assembly-enhancing protease